MDEDPSDETTIHALDAGDADDVLRFERENRAYFEATLPPRPDAYYTPEGIERAIAASVADREHDRAYLYVIRDRSGELVGRVNGFDVARGPVQSGHLGYRIGLAHGRRGHATRAVGLAVRALFDDHDLRRIEAAASPANLGSQVVLLKNGFEFWGRSRKSLLVQDVWIDSVHFERHREDAAR